MAAVLAKHRIPGPCNLLTKKKKWRPAVFPALSSGLYQLKPLPTSHTHTAQVYSAIRRVQRVDLQ